MKRAMVFAALILAAPALAEDCKNPQSQSAMNICADQDYQKADKALNAAYAALLEALSEPSFQQKLRVAQRSWISYRDKECIFETVGSEGATIHPLEYSGCLTRLTKDRIRALEASTTCTKTPENCG
jgi:uncharacterized protein YecT (DUF1311 family)